MSKIILNEDFDDEFVSDEITYDTDRYEEIKSKSVVDADGFTTDYTMYFDKDEQKYIFMFGDKEMTPPADEYADWMSEDEEIANSWFDHYVGFNEDEEISDEHTELQTEAYVATETTYHYVLRYDGGIEPVYYATGDRFVDDARDAAVREYDIYSEAEEDIENANDAWIHEADFEDELEALDGDYDALYDKFVEELGGFKPFRVIDEEGVVSDTDDDAPEGFSSVVEESLTEDTVKQGGKWVNKGKEGTHGRFKTKKEADAQRRAMFAQGYKEELEDNQPHYQVSRYSRWWWGILDNDRGLLMRVGPNADYTKGLDDADNKLLLFKSKDKARDYIQKYLNDVIEDKTEMSLSEPIEEDLTDIEDINFEDDFDDVDEIEITDLDEDCNERKSFSALEDVRSTLAHQTQEKQEAPKSSVEEMTRIDESESCEDLDDLN